MEKEITCVITGASSGIGKSAALSLAKMGYHMILILRDSEKSRTAYKEILANTAKEKVSMFYADFSSLNSVRKVAEEIKDKVPVIDILINNAGLFTKKESKTTDGFERTLAVNYLAPFLLTNLLLPNINKNVGRIINVSSELYKNGKIDEEMLSAYEKFNGEQVYANSKLLVNYFTKELALKIKDEKISVMCVHPGVVATDVFREFPKWFNAVLKPFISTPEAGAKPLLQLATMPNPLAFTGKYFYKLKEKPEAKVATDMLLSEMIWNKSLQLTNIN